MSKLNVPSFFNKNFHLIDLLNGCQQNLTFYTIFDFDQKFKLVQNSNIKEDYYKFIQFIKDSFINQDLVKTKLSFNIKTISAIKTLKKINFELFNFNISDVEKVLSFN